MQLSAIRFQNSQSAEKDIFKIIGAQDETVGATCCLRFQQHPQAE